jgi:hypothetical protein
VIYGITLRFASQQLGRKRSSPIFAVTPLTGHHSRRLFAVAAMHLGVWLAAWSWS